MSADRGGIRFVLDQGVPRDAADLLRQTGFDCTHVAEVGKFRADDTAILSWAREHNSTVVTLDADFHTILAVSGETAPSVIRFRLQGLNAPRVVELVRAVLARYRSELSQGCMITVKSKKTTCHRLPVGSAR